MKKLFAIFIAAILLFVGCAKIEDMSIKNANDEKTEIIFNLEDHAVTKAITTGNTLTGNFKVYGYTKPEANVTAGGFIMKDAEYNGIGANIGKPVSGTYYWPKADNNADIDVRFVAYSPITQVKTVNNGSDSKPESVTFNVTANAINGTDCIDLLYAIADNQHPVYATGYPAQNVLDENAKVALQFKHSLAWLQFQGKMSSEVTSCTVKSIVFSSALNSTGDMTINLRDNSTTPAWANKAGSLNQFITNPGASLTSSYTSISDAVIIPQNVPTSVTITFDLTVASGDETIEYYGRQVTRTINTGVDDNNHSYVATFDASHKYVYRLYVTATGVEFTITVDDWTTDSPNPLQIWDHDATAYVEHFFDKASTQMVPSLAIA